MPGRRKGNEGPRRRGGFSIPEVTHRHQAKRDRPHLASEMIETRGRGDDLANELLRHLMPWAQRAVSGREIAPVRLRNRG